MGIPCVLGTDVACFYRISSGADYRTSHPPSLPAWFGYPLVVKSAFIKLSQHLEEPLSLGNSISSTFALPRTHFLSRIARAAMESELELQAVIGFKGTVPQGLILHPDNEHLIFPLGCTVVIRNLLEKTQ